MTVLSANEIAMLTVLRAEVTRDTLHQVASLSETSNLAAGVHLSELERLLNGEHPTDVWPEVADGVLLALDGMPVGGSSHAARVFLAWIVLRWFRTFENTSWSGTEVLGFFVRSGVELKSEVQQTMLRVVMDDPPYIAHAVPQSFRAMAIILLAGSVLGRLAISLPKVVDQDTAASEEIIRAIGSNRCWFLELDWRGGHGTRAWEECVHLVLAPGGIIESGVSDIWGRWPRPSGSS